MNRTPRQKRYLLTSFGILCLTLSACETKVSQEGFPPATQMARTLQTSGATSKQAVLQTLGSPSVRNNFGAEVWYYISTEKESWWFFAPETTRQDVLKVSFLDNGEIEKVETLNKDNSYDVAFSTKETPTEGHKLGFAEQILGNVGRFNSAPSSAGQTRSSGSAIPGRW